MKVRTPMSGKHRFQMIGCGTLSFLGCIWLYPHVDTDGGQTFLAVGVVLGVAGVLAGVIGLQDHKL